MIDNPAKAPDTGWDARQWIENLRRAVGLAPVPATGSEPPPPFSDHVRTLADALLSERGEVLGTVIAHDLNRVIHEATSQELFAFLHLVANRYGPDVQRVAAAADAWRADPSPKHLAELTAAIEPPRQELFRRLNMAQGGTGTLVRVRESLLAQLGANPDLQPVDDDLKHLFASWFNRGFLQLRRIDWDTPASILEKLIAHEAVHAIDGWADLRRRLASDRRCFAFFHPALPDDPLIFIEVALVDHLSDRIGPIIRAPMPRDDRSDKLPAPTTAIFYSISNCQPGLKGVSFGNFLIKQVAADLTRELPSLHTFSTLSPIPTMRKWMNRSGAALDRLLPADQVQRLFRMSKSGDVAESIERLAAEATAGDVANTTLLQDVLLRLGAHYVAGVGLESGPRDPVARFHLGNGARVERINWMADVSAKGIRESYGLMVNYLYDLTSIEANHEAFANRRPIAVSKRVATLLHDASPPARARSLISHVDAAIMRRGD